MTKLCDLTCKACRGDVPPLTGEQIAPLHEQTPGWQVVDEHHLSRTFKFKDFAGALQFVNQVGRIAEQEGHHPNICFTWGRVTIEIHTHKVDGLTDSDFILAAKIDTIPL